MKILQRYIGGIVISHILVVCFAFFGILSFFQIMTEVTSIGKGTYSLFKALQYVLMIMPFNVYLFFPMAVLLGSLLSLGRLASSSELIIMQAAGVSLVQLTGFVLKAVLLLLVMVTFLGEGLAPKLMHYADTFKESAMKNLRLTSKDDVWVRQGNSFIHIDNILSDNRLQGVTRYQIDAQGQLQTISYAKEGHFSEGKWFFQDIEQSQLYADHVTSTHIASQTWDVQFSQRPAILVEVKPDFFNLWQLFQYIQHRLQNGLNTQQYDFIFWQRLLQPLATLIMVCLALPFVLGSLRSSSMGLRMMIGIMLGFVFFSLNRFSGYFSMLFQAPAFLAALLPILMFAVVAWVLLVRVR